MKRLLSIFALLTILSLSATTVFSQNDCITPDVISTLPYSATGLTTTGTLNDYDADDACGSTAMVNEDYVFSFTPAADMQINIALLNTAIVTESFLPYANVGLFITDACPDDIAAVCIASAEALSNPSVSDIDLVSGVTYYIIVSSANTALGDATNVNFDIEITKNPDLEIAITSIAVAASSCGLEESTIGCNITNNGVLTATGFDVTYTINEELPVVETFTETINPGESADFEFLTLANFPTVGEYDIIVSVNLIGDENTLNDEMSVTRVRTPLYNTYPFTEDFESDYGYWLTGGTASSWEYGNPDELIPELIINSAASGDNIWVTNLAGNTNTNEVSYIESPCYDLSSLFSSGLKHLGRGQC